MKGLSWPNPRKSLLRTFSCPRPSRARIRAVRNTEGTRWAQLVPVVLVNCLAREDKVHELLNVRIEISLRLALVKLLRSHVN
jgi:hypothetical protein